MPMFYKAPHALLFCMQLKFASDLHCVKINADNSCWGIINTKPCSPCCFVNHGTEKPTRTSFHHLKPVTK
jgi:hypothetical protein